MLNLYELEHLLAFAELGRLSRVSEHFHISTPTITRSMQHLEEAFGVSLFDREKNRISLNPTGIKAAEQARLLLEAHEHALEEVRNYDRAQHVISVKSCAPAPLWTLVPEISSAYPDRILETQILSIENIEQALADHSCHIAVLPYAFPDSTPYIREQLLISVKKEHQLASCKSVSFADINGYNFLLRSEIGFWDKLCREKMPASRFLIQRDNTEYDEIARNSMLPCFATDLGRKNGYSMPDRVYIPISDAEACVSFYIHRRGLF